MPKFNFKLQPLLKVKSQLEDNLKNVLGKAIQKLEMEKAALRSLESKKDRYINEFNEKSRKTTVDKLIKFNNYISFLIVKINRQKENVNCAYQNVDKIREELIKIVKERKILDKLKERNYEIFRQEQLKEESKIVDGIISFKQKRERGIGETDA